MASEFNIERISRVKSMAGLNRIYPLINKKEWARRMESTDYQTFMSRVRLHTRLDQTVDQQACAAEITELATEIFFEMGVWLGYFKPDPHWKVKYIDVNDPAEAHPERKI